MAKTVCVSCHIQLVRFAAHVKSVRSVHLGILPIAAKSVSHLHQEFLLREENRSQCLNFKLETKSNEVQHSFDILKLKLLHCEHVLI